MAFDAKECSSDTFALKNIHGHQMDFMADFERQDGISFFLIYYTDRELFYYLRFEKALYFWKRMTDGGRKSFRIDELEEDFFFSSPNGLWIPYLGCLSKDLEMRNVK